ncbi:sulfate transporter CysZ [Mangrovitalea sediminis]|uniref:sulfate transporter CysZ n=1 Tax=Mangrovitalea sediminis TaxID=1982043 RepID=UPI000BE4C122|nr:sulfate transporter CysZ [Mangrovitalea sediminis]
MFKGNFLHGFRYFREGFSLMWQPGLRQFVILPLILNVVIFLLMFKWLYDLFTLMINTVMGWLPHWTWLEPLQWLFWLIYGALLILLLAYGFVVVANLVGSPFYAFLAERTEERLTGHKPGPDLPWWRVLGEVPRAVWREVLKLLYYLPRAILLLVIGLVPVLNLVSTALWFLFNSWMMALQYVDYPADNHRVSLADLKTVLRARRMTSFGFGVPVAVGAMVPILNLFVVPAAVCGATLYWVRENAGESVGASPSSRPELY